MTDEILINDPLYIFLAQVDRVNGPLEILSPLRKYVYNLITRLNNLEVTISWFENLQLNN